jgi:drug/metabolite transporter (DMT)-like permease
MHWVLVGVIVTANTVSDLLQSHEMKRHGEIGDLGPGMFRRVLATIARRRFLLLAVACMAVSFFTFLKLISIAGLSFAVPATALSLVVETFFARYILHERVTARRWAGACLVASGVILLAS